MELLPEPLVLKPPVENVLELAQVILKPLRLMAGAASTITMEFGVALPVSTGWTPPFIFVPSKIRAWPFTVPVWRTPLPSTQLLPALKSVDTGIPVGDQY